MIKEKRSEVEVVLAVVKEYLNEEKDISPLLIREF